MLKKKLLLRNFSSQLESRFQGDDLSKSKRNKLKKIFLLASISFSIGCVLYFHQPSRKVVFIITSKLRSMVAKKKNPEVITETTTKSSSIQLRVAATLLLILVGTLVVTNQEHFGDTTVELKKSRYVQSQIVDADSYVFPNLLLSWLVNCWFIRLCGL